MINALFLTIFVGLFFIIGIYIPKLFPNKQRLILTTTSLSLIIMLDLLIFDLAPEIIEIFDPLHNIKNALIILISVLIGGLALKTLDLFIPEHHHDHHEKEDDIEEHNNHLYHIGLITAISLMVHNILEGISIYITGMENFKLGLLMALTVGFHNLPLGIEVSASLESSKKSKLAKYMILFLLVISSFLGAFTLYVFNADLSSLIEGILLSITLGMIFYISIFELLPEVITNKKEKEIKIGLILGIILAIILFII